MNSKYLIFFIKIYYLLVYLCFYSCSIEDFTLSKNCIVKVSFYNKYLEFEENNIFLKNDKKNKIIKSFNILNDEFLIFQNFGSKIYSNDAICLDTEFKEGWDIYSININEELVFTYGILEGFTFATRMENHYLNINQTLYPEPFKEEVINHINEQMKFSRKLILDEKEDELYRKALNNTLTHFDGLVKGYDLFKEYQKERNLFVKQNQSTIDFKDINEDLFLKEIDIIVLSLLGELSDITNSYKTTFENKKQDFLSKECTIFSKIIINESEILDNILYAHNTHNIYSLMNRSFKIIKSSFFNSYKFSSRPGDLNSKDDFYIIDNLMVVAETSLEILDKNLYKYIKTDSIPKWIRVNIANKIAKNPREWIDVFFKYNSGTHNNQWILLDLVEFSKMKGKNVNDINKEKLIYIVEQLPLDEPQLKDITKELFQDSYVAGYNTPYFQFSYDFMGYKGRPDYSTARRNKLIKNEMLKVFNFEDAKKAIRYFDLDDICDNINPRCDYNSNTPFGGIDGKVFSYENQLQIISSPPSNKLLGVEPFCFGEKFKNYPHFGINECMNFSWISIEK